MFMHVHLPMTCVYLLPERCRVAAIHGHTNREAARKARSSFILIFTSPYVREECVWMRVSEPTLEHTATLATGQRAAYECERSWTYTHTQGQKNRSRIITF